MDDGLATQSGLAALPVLASRRKTLSKLLDVRAIVTPRSAVFDLSCSEFHRCLDDYAVALTEAAPGDFTELSWFLTTVPTDIPDRPWLFAAAGDLIAGPMEARRRLALLDLAANQQLLDPH